MKIVDTNGIQHYSHNGLVDHQKKMISLLKVVVEICKLHQLRYWLDGGALLGLYRYNDLLPWDDDIDICVPESFRSVVWR